MPSSLELTDPELLVLARSGDQSAYGRLISRHQTLIASLAYSICGDFARSQDIAQEAFVAAWRQLGSLEDAAKFKSWLCGITRNLGHNLLRQQIRHAEQQATPLETIPEATADTPSPHEHAVTREEASIVWHALEQLPENYREPLILFYREHHSVERVATALELSEDTVKQRLSRGRGMLREQVEKLVERSLGFTTPGVMFTTAVLSALPVVAPQIVAATVASTAAKGSAAAKAAASLSWSATIAGPAIGLAGAYFSGREALRHTRSAGERTFIKRLYGVLGVFILLSNLGVFVMIWRLHRQLNGEPQTFGLMLFAWTWLMLTGIIVIMLWGHRRFREYARHVRLPENTSRWRKRFWFGPDRALAYRSKLTFFGLPLIDIRFGQSTETPLVRGTARGWIAIGDIAQGVVLAVGGIAMGGNCDRWYRRRDPLNRFCGTRPGRARRSGRRRSNQWHYGHRICGKWPACLRLGSSNRPRGHRKTSRPRSHIRRGRACKR